MLENWVWEHDSLVRMSGRLKDGAPLPEDLIETLLKARQANAGLITKRQILFSLFDQTLHRQAIVNTAEIYTKMCKDVGCAQGLHLVAFTSPRTNLRRALYPFGYLRFAKLM
jgi:Zn-dependent oligopeptidase